MSYYEPNEQEREERYNGLIPFDYWNGRCLLGIFASFGKPDTYADFGCGSGAMVKFARQCGVLAVGVDVIASEPDIQHDLRKPLDLGQTFQLVTSIEVAEHLPEEDAKTFVQNIAKHMHKGSLLVFTAAVPGQPGDNHVNCQPKEYWRALFEQEGVVTYSKPGVDGAGMAVTVKPDYDALYAIWSTLIDNVYVTVGPNMHLFQNLQVFRKV